MSVSEDLKKLATLYERKNKDYGDAYKKTGEILSIMNPLEGDSNSQNRTQLFGTMIGKMIRTGNLLKADPDKTNFEGIADTLDDLSVYSQMLKEVILETNNEKGENDDQD